MDVRVTFIPHLCKGKRKKYGDSVSETETTVFGQNFSLGALKMLFLFFRQDGILSVISLGWWFCFPSQQIRWKISLALPSILWLFLGNYRILIIKQKQLLCCSSFPKRVFIFVCKSSTSEVDYQQSLFCLSPSRHANASVRRSYTHVLPSLTLTKKRDCSQSTSKFQLVTIMEGWWDKALCTRV